MASGLDIMSGDVGEPFGVLLLAGSERRTTECEATIFVYDATGRLVAEYSTIVANSTDAKVAYLTNDHLGSPRINTDANGAVTARHDYHPFGEEIGTLAALPGSPQPRTTALGYTTDTVRKQFTGYERDKEINLDFAEARYYNFHHGRFTTTDALLSTGEPDDPQTWHRYAYALNNPLFYTDPTGMYVCKGTKDQCEQFAKRLAEAKDYLKKIEEEYGKDSKQYKKAEAAVNSYGEDETGKKTNNGVFVIFSQNDGTAARTTGTFADKGKLQRITVRFDGKALDSDSSQALVAHEGSQVDYFQTVGNIKSRYDFEFRGYEVQSLFLEAQFPDSVRNFTAKDGTKYPIWNPSWEGPDKETLRSNAVRGWLAVPVKNGGYGLTPPKPKPPPTKKLQRSKRG